MANQSIQLAVVDFATSVSWPAQDSLDPFGDCVIQAPVLLSLLIAGYRPLLCYPFDHCPYAV